MALDSGVADVEVVVSSGRHLALSRTHHPPFLCSFQSAFMTKYFPQPTADDVAAEAKRSKTLADFFPDSQPLSLNGFLEVRCKRRCLASMRSLAWSFLLALRCSRVN